jgi:predicted transcriptional regulator
MIRICSSHGGIHIVDGIEWKAKKVFVEELKRQWSLLWAERIDDEVRAEGIANQDFSLLLVDRGTVIMATRDYKPLDFRQILQEHKLVQVESMVSPNPSVGGYGKFAREVYGGKLDHGGKRQAYENSLRPSGPMKKGGRGWLHAKMWVFVTLSKIVRQLWWGFLSKYRDRIEIIADILNIAKDGARKTQIMYKGNLSYKLLTRYLEVVIGSGLVFFGENSNVYRLTEKGLTFLRNFEDYSKNRVEVERRMSDIRSSRERLNEMCALKRIPRRLGFRDDSHLSEESDGQYPE